MTDEEVRAALEKAAEEEFNVEDAFAAVAQAFAPIWDDPEMDIYNDYDRYWAELNQKRSGTGDNP